MLIRHDNVYEWLQIFPGTEHIHIAYQTIYALKIMNNKCYPKIKQTNEQQ